MLPVSHNLYCDAVTEKSIHEMSDASPDNHVARRWAVRVVRLKAAVAHRPPSWPCAPLVATLFLRCVRCVVVVKNRLLCSRRRWMIHF